MPVRLEELLDRISDTLINSDVVTPDVVKQNQKTIRDGKLQLGRDQIAYNLILYQTDVEANQKDLLVSDNVETETTSLQTLSELIEDINLVAISIEPTNDSYTISLTYDSVIYDLSYLVNKDSNNPLNVSQFIPLEQQQKNVNISQAEEFLDTNIYELLPTGDSRQSRILRFFQELNALLPPTAPEFDLVDTQGNPTPDGRVDRDIDGNWSGATEYSQNNSISYAQENQDGNIDEEEAFIHRLVSTSNETNEGLTIEDIYDTIRPYLDDILEPSPSLTDERPEYQNKSNGYLQFRNLNQGIIIRNTNKDYIDGLDPNNPTWLTTNPFNTIFSDSINDRRDFLLDNSGTGFTITMWVRFLDKTSQGTLFNFGNPTLDNQNNDVINEPFGFKLETFVVTNDQVFDNGQTYGEFVNENRGGLGNQIFSNSDSARFVRLQVREYGNADTARDEGLRDSHTGNISVSKLSTNYPDLNVIGDDEKRVFNYTYIPEDFNEWFFICANYNPSIIEPSELQDDMYNFIYEDFKNNTNFWLNHINPLDGTFSANSGYGNKCKVEIISKTDLLRARGFKVN